MLLRVEREPELKAFQIQDITKIWIELLCNYKDVRDHPRRLGLVCHCCWIILQWSAPHATVTAILFIQDEESDANGIQDGSIDLKKKSGL